MRSHILLAGVTAFAAGAAAVPHARAHARAHQEAHAKRQQVVTRFEFVTVHADNAQPQQTPEPVTVHHLQFANEAPPQPSPVTVHNLQLAQGGGGGGGACNQPDPPGFNGFTPGGFTPCGFTPRVTATAAQVITLANGQKSVSHLEQTLGVSTLAHAPGATVAPNSNGGPGDPVGFPSDPSVGRLPSHEFEVIVNEPPQPGGRDYPGTILLQTNFHRRNQSAPDLIWGFGLQRSAQDLANKCVFQQDLTISYGGYGQALVAGVDPSEVGRVITDTFYNPQVGNFEGLYGQANPEKSDFNNWGFFTQLVWKSTQQIGCYSVDCAGKGGLKGKPAGASDGFTVCNFFPAGNVDGQYAANVGPQGDYPTMQWDDSTWSQVSGN